MSARRSQRGSSRTSTVRGSTGRVGHLHEHIRTALASRADTTLTFLDRVRGLGCRSGDMRLAYGWRRSVVRTAFVAGLLGLGSRVALTALFVWFIADGIVPVTGFNVAITVLGAVTLGLAHVGRVPLSISKERSGVRVEFRRRPLIWIGDGLRYRSLARIGDGLRYRSLARIGDGLRRGSVISLRRRHCRTRFLARCWRVAVRTSGRFRRWPRAIPSYRFSFRHRIEVPVLAAVTLSEGSYPLNRLQRASDGESSDSRSVSQSGHSGPFTTMNPQFPQRVRSVVICAVEKLIN